MKQHVSSIIVVVICAVFNSCTEKDYGDYHFSQPSQTIELGNKLSEISGLQWLSDSTIACIQDEKAKAYLLNSYNGKIIQEIDFDKKGDFEGIAMNSTHTYMLRSDGSIFVSNNFDKLQEYKFKKEGNFEFEGICLDPKGNRLLIACKQHGNKNKRDNLFIYEFSIKSNSYVSKPVFKLKKEDAIPSNFKSSGIGIHPITQDIYVLSSFSKTILVLSAQGRVKGSTQLNEEIYHQPEGITFSKDGTMFISNEKHKTVPTLLRLDYHNSLKSNY